MTLQPSNRRFFLMIGILSFLVGTYVIEMAGRLALVWLILAMFSILCALFLPESFLIIVVERCKKAGRIFLVFCLAILGGVIFAASRADIGVIGLSWSLVLALAVASVTNAALRTEPWYLNGLNLAFLCLTIYGLCLLYLLPSTRIVMAHRADTVSELQWWLGEPVKPGPASLKAAEKSGVACKDKDSALHAYRVDSFLIGCHIWACTRNDDVLLTRRVNYL